MYAPVYVRTLCYSPASLFKVLKRKFVSILIAGSLEHSVYMLHSKVSCQCSKMKRFCRNRLMA